MLNSKQRARLRALASVGEATTIIGANGVTDAVINQIKTDFYTRELLKVKVLPNCGNVVEDCMSEVCLALKAEPVCTIGNFFVIYKINNKKNFNHLLQE